ncbi:MAG: hypothetical protein SFU56_15120 [Capsulimonadales bacterium]|nr:hypothetical protein [Capsulimonadales bacterium]
MKQQVNGSMIIVAAMAILALIVGIGIFFLNPPVVRRDTSAGESRGAAAGGAKGRSAMPSQPSASLN